MRYRLRARRERLGLTQDQVAERAGLRWPSQVSHAERSKSAPWPVLKAIRAVLLNAECERHEERKRAREERERRALGAQIPEHVRAAMLQRAHDLLWDGNTDGCDALLEFLPEVEVTEMLDAWESDQAGEGPKSRWY